MSIINDKIASETMVNRFYVRICGQLDKDLFNKALETLKYFLKFNTRESLIFKIFTKLSNVKKQWMLRSLITLPIGNQLLKKIVNISKLSSFSEQTVGYLLAQKDQWGQREFIVNKILSERNSRLLSILLEFSQLLKPFKRKIYIRLISQWIISNNPRVTEKPNSLNTKELNILKVLTLQYGIELPRKTLELMSNLASKYKDMDFLGVAVQNTNATNEIINTYQIYLMKQWSDMGLCGESYSNIFITSIPPTSTEFAIIARREKQRREQRRKKLPNSITVTETTRLSKLFFKLKKFYRNFESYIIADIEDEKRICYDL